MRAPSVEGRYRADAQTLCIRFTNMLVCITLHSAVLSSLGLRQGRGHESYAPAAPGGRSLLHYLHSPPLRKLTFMLDPAELSPTASAC